MVEIDKDGIIRIPEPTPVFKFALTESVIKACAAPKTYERPERFTPEQFLPTNINGTDTGWDVRAADDYVIKPGSYEKIQLGFRVFAPDGWWLKLVPRSSTHFKKFCNCLYGIIDPTFEGQLMLSVQYLPRMELKFADHYHNTPKSFGYPYRTTNDLNISFGERIAQIIPVRRQEMICEAVSNEEYDKLCAERGGKRGAGGFGASGQF
jgi:dUTPase